MARCEWILYNNENCSFRGEIQTPGGFFCRVHAKMFQREQIPAEELRQLGAEGDRKPRIIRESRPDRLTGFSMSGPASPYKRTIDDKWKKSKFIDTVERYLQEGGNFRHFLDITNIDQNGEGLRNRDYIPLGYLFSTQNNVIIKHDEGGLWGTKLHYLKDLTGKDLFGVEWEIKSRRAPPKRRENNQRMEAPRPSAATQVKSSVEAPPLDLGPVRVNLKKTSTLLETPDPDPHPVFDSGVVVIGPGSNSTSRPLSPSVRKIEPISVSYSNTVSPRSLERVPGSPGRDSPAPPRAPKSFSGSPERSPVIPRSSRPFLSTPGSPESSPTIPRSLERVPGSPGRDRPVSPRSLERVPGSPGRDRPVSPRSLERVPGSPGRDRPVSPRSLERVPGSPGRDRPVSPRSLERVPGSPGRDRPVSPRSLERVPGSPGRDRPVSPRSLERVPGSPGRDRPVSPRSLERVPGSPGRDRPVSPPPVPYGLKLPKIGERLSAVTDKKVSPRIHTFPVKVSKLTYRADGSIESVSVDTNMGESIFYPSESGWKSGDYYMLI
jgi:hypothetical protein